MGAIDSRRCGISINTIIVVSAGALMRAQIFQNRAPESHQAQRWLALTLPHPLSRGQLQSGNNFSPRLRVITINYLNVD